MTGVPARNEPQPVRKGPRSPTDRPAPTPDQDQSNPRFAAHDSTEPHTAPQRALRPRPETSANRSAGDHSPPQTGRHPPRTRTRAPPASQRTTHRATHRSTGSTPAPARDERQPVRGGPGVGVSSGDPLLATHRVECVVCIYLNIGAGVRPSAIFLLLSHLA